MKVMKALGITLAIILLMSFTVASLYVSIVIAVGIGLYLLISGIYTLLSIKETL